MTTQPSILTTLQQEKYDFGHQTMSRDSLSWLMKRIADLRSPSRLITPITKEKTRHTRHNDRQKFLMGGLYYFMYDPKGKDDMPYYDRFPLVMPLKREVDGFLGLNFHYLHITCFLSLYITVKTVRDAVCSAHVALSLPLPFFIVVVYIPPSARSSLSPLSHSLSAPGTSL
jgi:hypothetical protein